MATIALVRTAWAGTSGGPGITQLFFRDFADASPSAGQAQSLVNAVRAYFDGIKALIPNDVSLTTSPVVDAYDPETGQLLSSVTAATPPTSVIGTYSSTFSMASGLKMNLNTGAIRFGRRVRGSIFIVPAGGVYSDTGNITSGNRTTVNTAGAGLLAAANLAGADLVVWSRPREEPTTRAGAATIVTGVETSEKVAVLRGRRD